MPYSPLSKCRILQIFPPALQAPEGKPLQLPSHTRCLYTSLQCDSQLPIIIQLEMQYFDKNFKLNSIDNDLEKDAIALPLVLRCREHQMCLLLS